LGHSVHLFIIHHAVHIAQFKPNINTLNIFNSDLFLYAGQVSIVGHLIIKITILFTILIIEHSIKSLQARIIKKDSEGAKIVQ